MVLENFTNGYDVANGSVIASGEKNDCTVRAIANAFNVCYDTAHDYAKTIFGRENRKGIRGFGALLSAVKMVSFKQTSGQLSLFEQSSNWNVKGLSQSQLINPQYKHKPVKWTVKTFCARYNRGTYIITVKGHALTIKDGVIMDNPNYRFTGFRRPVINAFKISRK
jgi:hypothetical protein